MKNYYDILLLFDCGRTVSRLQMLNFGNGKYTEDDIDSLEKQGYIRKVGENYFNEPEYMITDKGQKYRNN